jgi:hypothetical protein
MLEVLGTIVEPSGLYAIAGVVLLALFSVIGLIMFASKEPDFEDVVAEQRKEQQELITSLQAGSKSGKSKSKNKKWKKKEKKVIPDEDADSGVDDIDPSTESLIKVEPEPEPQAPPPKKKNRKNKKHKEPVVIEVEPESSTIEEFVTEEIITSTDASIDQTPVDIIHEDVIVSSEEIVEESIPMPIEEEIVEAVDDLTVETIPEMSEISEISEIPEILEIPEIPEIPTIEEEPSEPAALPTPEIVAASTHAKKNKKSKANKAVKPQEGSFMTLEKLQKEIESAQMDAGEVQQIIDVLLAKQNEMEQWQKPGQKNDPIEQLKRQVAELEAKLTDEKTIAVAALTKSKQYRNEALHEKSQLSAYEKQATEKINQLTRDSEATRKRSEQSQEKLNLDIQSRDSQIRRMQELIDSGSNHEVTKLKEEIQNLKQASIRAQQLTEDNNSLMGELNQLQQNNKRTLQQYSQIEERAKYFEGQASTFQQHMEQSEQMLSARLQEVSDSLLQSEAEKHNLIQQLQSVQIGSDVVQVEHVTSSELPPAEFGDQSDLQQRLHEEQAEKSELLQQVQKYKSDFETLQQKFEESLLNEDHQTNGEVDLVEGDPSDLESLKALLAEKKAENETMQTTIDQAKEKNNDLREKNWKAMDAVSKAEKLGKDMVEDMKRQIFRGLKQVHPDLAIPKEDSMELIMATYAHNQKIQEEEERAEMDTIKEQYAVLDQLNSSKKEENDALNAELATIREQNIILERQLSESAEISDTTEITENADMVALRQQNADLEQHNSAQKEENAALLAQIDELKNAPVESAVEIVKVEPESTEELEQALRETEHYKKVLNETEALLSRLQEGVDVEITNKSEQLAEVTKASEAKDSHIAELSSLYNGTREELAAVQQQLAAANTDDLNAKLKKTIAERDLLIREYKQAKEQVTSLQSKLESVAKEQAEVKSQDSPQVIQLQQEIVELKERLNEDAVLISVDPYKTEELQSKVDQSTGQVSELQEKLTAAESKLTELQSNQAKIVETEIAEAMKQVQAELAEAEKAVEQERLANKQLTVQLHSVEAAPTSEAPVPEAAPAVTEVPTPEAAPPTPEAAPVAAEEDKPRFSCGPQVTTDYELVEFGLDSSDEEEEEASSPAAKPTPELVTEVAATASDLGTSV